MIAIIYNSSTVSGIHPTPNIEEFDANGVEYELVEEIPALIANTPEGHYVIKNDAGELEAVPFPVPEPTEEQQRITQLEADNLTLMEAVFDLYLLVNPEEGGV
ncbi:hypothetical protein M6D81_11815 [Paenibacillus sp. J5C_2022]|uniref:hypothetical protein n=1 Tax=Paenibacillus sp. J5C2022 TaxID=2977129 RepID=UPI0021CE192E|nr:hypothetical protein [Paenibacillus sp. J5C2022]MCU6709391.1 hypothetical protein [Paenibacillus sp. J5C2022]